MESPRKPQDHVIISPRGTDSPRHHMLHVQTGSAHTHRTRNRIIMLLLLLAGLGGILFAVRQRQETRRFATNTGMTLAMNAGSATYTVNDTFVIGLTVNTGDNTLTAAALSVSYNPQILEAVSIQEGNYLPVVLVPGAVTAGRATITLGVTPTDPKQGSGILAVISFRAKAAGTSAITYDASTEAAALGKTTNALTGIQGTQITITTAAGATPTPSPIRTPTPTPTTAPARYYIQDDMCQASTQPPANTETFDSLSACIGRLNELIATPTVAGQPSPTPSGVPDPTPSVSGAPTPTPTPAPFTADFTQDGKVSFWDFVLFMNYWWANDLARADLNDDGKINTIDYTIVLNEWYDSLQNN